MIFKKLIFTLIALGLLCGFQASTSSDFSFEKSEVFDFASDASDTENEDSKIESSKFFSENSQIFHFLKITLNLAVQSQMALQKNFSAIPTSPPNC